MAFVTVPNSGTQFDLSEACKTLKGVVAGQKMFGRYVLEKILGRGGMGIVWLARDLRLDRVVALKVLPDEVFYDQASREDLKNETRKSLELTHPNIVRIHDFAEDETAAAISMEYVDGATLSQWRIQSPNKVLEAEALGPWVLEICDALHYAHQSAKLLHRDLKPANVMVNARNQVKITDFGIACSLHNSLSRVSIRQSSSGTLAYMSPEQMMGEAPSPRDDIYALGATLYEVMTSKPPFYEGDIALQVRNVEAAGMNARRGQLGIAGRKIPKAWEETVARCLAKDPAKRPENMMEMASLLGLLDQPSLKRQHHAAAAAGTAKPGSLKDKLGRMTPILLGLAAAAAVGALPGIFFSRHSATVAAPPVRPRPPQAASTPASSPIAVRTPAPAAVLPAPVVLPEAKPAPARDGRLEIVTTPAGLKFHLFKGSMADLNTSQEQQPVLEGATPATLQNLERGHFTVVCERQGWSDEAREVSISPDASRVEIAFPSGTLTVKSTPEGAAVQVDGEPAGVTPFTLETAPGDHEVTATLKGKPDQDEEASVGVGKESTLLLHFSAAAHRHGAKHAKPPPKTGWQKLGATFGKIFGTSPKPTPRH